MGFLYLDDLGGEEYATSGNQGILDICDGLKWVHYRKRTRHSYVTSRCGHRDYHHDIETTRHRERRLAQAARCACEQAGGCAGGVRKTARRSIDHERRPERDDGKSTSISNNVCDVKVFFEHRTARTPRSCFDSALVEELIIDDEGSHVICRGGTRSDPTISPIARSTMITTSNSLNRERDAQSSGR